MLRSFTYAVARRRRRRTTGDRAGAPASAFLDALPRGGRARRHAAAARDARAAARASSSSRRRSTSCATSSRTGPTGFGIPVAGIVRLLERASDMTRRTARSSRIVERDHPTRTTCSARTCERGARRRARVPARRRRGARAARRRRRPVELERDAPGRRLRGRAAEARAAARATGSRSPTPTAARSSSTTRTRSCRRSASSTSTSPPRAATSSSTRSSARTCARSTASRGTAFAVWAPNARSVSVVGDFNGWDGRLHPMRSLGASGIWELFLPGRRATGARYKFELRGQDGTVHLHADPLALRDRGAAADRVGRLTSRTTSGATSEWIERRARGRPAGAGRSRSTRCTSARGGRASRYRELGRAARRLRARPRLHARRADAGDGAPVRAARGATR